MFEVKKEESKGRKEGRESVSKREDANTEGSPRGGQQKDSEMV